MYDKPMVIIPLEEYEALKRQVKETTVFKYLELTQRVNIREPDIEKPHNSINFYTVTQKEIIGDQRGMRYLVQGMGGSRFIEIYNL